MTHRRPALAGLGIAALTFAPLASADPTAGHDAKVNTQTPRMLCEIGSDDADPGIGPNGFAPRKHNSRAT
jgi:hypothetical protein